MTIAQNRGYVKWGKRQLQEVRNAVFSPSLKAISYPFGMCWALAPSVQQRTFQI